MWSLSLDYSRGASALPDSTLRVLTLELRWTKTHIPAYLIRQWTTLGRSLHFLCQFFSKLGTYTYRFVVLLNVCSASSQQVLVNGSYYCDCWFRWGSQDLCWEVILDSGSFRTLPSQAPLIIERVSKQNESCPLFWPVSSIAVWLIPHCTWLVTHVH